MVERRRGVLNPERYIGTQENVEVVAVYPWVPAMPDKVLEDLRQGRDPGLVRILLGRKPETGSIASSMLTPLRDYIPAGIKPLEQAYQGIRKYSTFLPVPVLAKPTEKGAAGVQIYISDEPFEFKIGPQTRSLNIVSLPIWPPRLMRGEIIAGSGHEGLKDIVPFSVNELEAAFSSGEHGSQKLVESSTTLDLPVESPVRFESEMMDIRRKQELGKLLGFFRSRSNEVESMIVRKLGFKSGTISLLNAYRTIVIEHPDYADELLIDAVEKAQNEIFFGLFRQEDDPYLYSEREISMEELYQRVELEFSRGSYGREVLKAAAVESFRATPIAEGTNAIKVFNAFWDRLFLEAKEKSGVEHIADPTDADALLDINRRISKKMVELLSDITNFGIDKILYVYRESIDYVEQIGAKVASLLPDHDLHQIHQPRNEIQNADLATLMSYVHGETEFPELRFEARRQLFHFMKYLIATKYYDDEVNHQNQEFNYAINTIFGDVEKNKVKMAKDRYLEVRKGKDGYRVLVDFRGVKKKASAVRTSMQKRIKDIHDYFAYSIVLIDDFGGDIQAALEANERIIENFEKYIKELFPEDRGYMLTIDPKHDKRKGIENFEYWIENDRIPDTDIEQTGRAGSQNEKIVRRKVLFELTDPTDRKHFCEIAFYPFARFRNRRNGIFNKATAAGFMSWEDKLKDDKRYGEKRVIEGPSKIEIGGKKYGTYGEVDEYADNFPASIYPHSVTLQRVKSNGI